jgi:D-beta-D-heptose 7-phosphate kinase/D-beta-D-heptose 1-phosphate adenosyltransferase
MPQAMQLANIAAGIVVGKPGTAVVTTEELKHELELGAHGIIDSSSPLISRTAAANLSQQWKEAALRVGFTNGCFDILHAGHISILQQGRSQCDRLFVGLNTDAGVRRLKGPQRPVNTLEDRARVLSAIKYVDAIVPFGEETPRALIEMLQPDVLIKGSDYTMDTVVGADLVQANGGTVFLADIMSERSTTGIISRIRNLA